MKMQRSQTLLLAAVTAVVTLATSAPATFCVRLDTDVPHHESTPITLEVTRSLAPLGADQFYALCEDQFYDDAAFFRVVPGFVVQFGIAGDPAENKK